jgi:hypothetical protein
MTGNSQLQERASLVLTRVYPVAPEKVWRAYRVIMRGREGEYHDVRGVYRGGTELQFTQDPIFDPRARDGWRGAFKRLGLLLQQTH